MLRAASTARRTSSRSMSRERWPSVTPPRLLTPRTWLPATPMHGGFDGDVGDAFGFFDGAANRADGGIEIDDETFAQALGFGGAQRQKFHLFFVHFRDQRAGLRAADVQPDDVTIFFCQAAAPALDR